MSAEQRDLGSMDLAEKGAALKEEAAPIIAGVRRVPYRQLLGDYLDVFIALERLEDTDQIRATGQELYRLRQLIIRKPSIRAAFDEISNIAFTHFPIPDQDPADN